MKKSADLVVYGKIFTSENNQMAEALASLTINVARPEATYFESKKVFTR